MGDEEQEDLTQRKEGEDEEMQVDGEATPT
jgi:hypothetical protein